MALLIEEKSTLTAKGQTTVPKVVREALGVRSGDQIAYRVDSEGKVTLSRHEAGSDEAAIDSFLAFLANVGRVLGGDVGLPAPAVHQGTVQPNELAPRLRVGRLESDQ